MQILFFNSSISRFLAVASRFFSVRVLIAIPSQYFAFSFNRFHSYLLMFLTFFISCFSEASLFSRDFTVERSSRISVQNFCFFPSAGQFCFVSFSLVSRLIMVFLEQQFESQVFCTCLWFPLFVL